MNRILIFIYGPTAVGKSTLAEQLALHLPTEIINGDAAQMYVPLTIGTAKPDWQKSPINHHMFDVVDEPRACNAAWYSTQARQIIETVWNNNKIPLVVGGSGFYLYSLLFDLQQAAQKEHATSAQIDEMSWTKLAEIDPLRASHIHPSDLYRIKRALTIWNMSGVKPSQYKPSFNPPPADIIIFVSLTRQTNDLADIIERRTTEMLQHGWIEETKKLMDTPWEAFVQERKFIGYQELFEQVRGFVSLDEAQKQIIRKTQQYAKRQNTFLKMMTKKLASYGTVKREQANLTFLSADLYIKQLIETIKKYNDSKQQ